MHLKLNDVLGLVSKIVDPKELAAALQEFRRHKANKRNNYAKAFGKCRLVVDPSPAQKKRPHTRGYIHANDSL